MNYVRHLNAFAKHAQLHPDWDCFHLSLYYVLFHLWNYKKFRPLFKVKRETVMRASRIKSTKKYYECLKKLHRSGMIVYYPAGGLKLLATISMVELSDPVIKTPVPACKPADDVVSAAGATDVAGVQDIAQASSIPTTGAVVHIAWEDAIDDTGGVQHIAWPCATNDTDRVVQTAHSLKEKLIENLKSEGVNGPTPTVNNNFYFSSSPATDTVTPCLPPSSIQVVKDYFLQQGYPLLEATNFFDYYAVTGWKTRSGAPVANWQGAARRWMHTGKSQQRVAINTLKHAGDQHLHTTRNKDYSKPL